MYADTSGWALKCEILRLMDKYTVSLSHTQTHTELIFFYNKSTFYLRGYTSSQLIHAFRSNEIRVHK